MDRVVLSQRITSILSDLDRLTNTLYALNVTDINRYPENYELLSTDAALKAEMITCHLRHLVYAATNTPKNDYLIAAAEQQGIEVRYEDSILEVTLPCLLPKKKQRQSREFLLDPLTFYLSDYAKSHALPHMNHCVICFSHIYNKELPERRIRDYDNLELKQYLDVIASFVLTDDNGLLCDAYNTTELGESDCTKIFVMDSTRFSSWIEERQKNLQSIADL